MRVPPASPTAPEKPSLDGRLRREKPEGPKGTGRPDGSQRPEGPEGTRGTGSRACRRLERQLAAGAAPDDPTLVAHRSVCRSCDELVVAWERARGIVGDCHVEVEPGPDFSVRVLERVAAERSDLAVLGWAARSLLPVAAALILVLAGWSASLEPPAGPESLLWAGANDEALARFVLSGIAGPDAGGAP